MLATPSKPATPCGLLPRLMLFKSTARGNVADTAQDKAADASDKAGDVADDAADAVGDAADDAGDTAEGLVDKAKHAGGVALEKGKSLAQSLDDKLEAASQKEGFVGSAAGFGHKVLDKIDGD